MGQFFKMLLASCLGVLIAGAVIIGFGVLIIAGLASSSTKPPKLEPNTVLQLDFNEAVPEKTNNIMSDGFSLETDDIIGLTDIVELIGHAKEDNKIKGIILKADMLNMGRASASVIREALEDFRSSGKFIYAYADMFSEGAYYLASASDSIYVNPMGGVDFKGMAASISFYKNLMDKAGVKMQVFYAGEFKSATEPFRLTQMSDQNRLQVREFLEDIYNTHLNTISSSRNISPEKLRQLANDYVGSDAEKAREAGLIDGVIYWDQFLDRLRNRMGMEADDKIPVVSLDKYYLQHKDDTDYGVKDKIAVVYAEGDIVGGKNLPGFVADEDYIHMLRKIRKDKTIKAVVLRVNSPGGSALTSEKIWRELTQIKEAGKPLIVSMGDYAASGGYYIACIGDTILAEPNTLTGSIGVFRMIPNARELMENKLGITMDTVKTTKHATGLSLYYEIEPEMGAILQKQTEEMYATFLKRVADGRGMSVSAVNEIGRGRIWTGRKALEIGLVDKIGGLEDALEIAAQKAGLEKYRTSEYPKVKSPIEQMLEKFIDNPGDQAKTKIIQEELGDFYPLYQQMKAIQNQATPQARLPFVINIQ